MTWPPLPLSSELLNTTSVPTGYWEKSMITSKRSADAIGIDASCCGSAGRPPLLPIWVNEGLGSPRFACSWRL